MEPTQAELDKIITLNVGGSIFSTTLQTLLSDPDSMLARMFANYPDIGLTRDDAGKIFIDRDGTHFRYILNYLRDGDRAFLPTDSNVRAELLVEADFYQISGLIKKLKAKIPDPDLDWKLDGESLAEATLEALKAQYPKNYRHDLQRLREEILKASRQGLDFVEYVPEKKSPNGKSFSNDRGYVNALAWYLASRHGFSVTHNGNLIRIRLMPVPEED